MVDNTEEENLDTPTNTQSENTPEEIILTKDTETINPNQETENMEVHKHPHHVTHRKKWGEYLLEFLMLFLAVFLGFVAENIREHTVEKGRAKEYAQSLYKDLQNDTADIKKAALYENGIVNFIDSLANLVSSSDLSQKGGQLYYYMRLASFAYNVDWNKATLNQLINSGNLRYFTNTKLVTQLGNYNTITIIISNQDNVINEKRKRAQAYKDRIAIPKLEQAFSTISSDDIILGRNNTLIDSIRNINIPVQNNSTDMLYAFANAVLDTKNNRKNQRTKYYPKAIKLATEIMELLKKEYQLE
jgi:hypothetical protein